MYHWHFIAFSTPYSSPSLPPSFQLFASGGGGCCDCGDPEAWTSEVHCQKHKPTQQRDDEVNLSVIHIHVHNLSVVRTAPCCVKIFHIQNNPDCIKKR